MKKLLVWFSILFFFGSLVYSDYRAARVMGELKQENRILMTNNVNLIKLNRTLSEGVGMVTDKLLEKAEWDEKVAEKIRQLDASIKKLNDKERKSQSN